MRSALIHSVRTHWKYRIAQVEIGVSCPVGSPSRIGAPRCYRQKTDHTFALRWLPFNSRAYMMFFIPNF